MIAAVAIRIVWNLLRRSSGGAGEAMNVAVAIARGRGFADAYFPGQGATAHLLPISPGVAGLVYATLGIKTPAAEIVLASWSIGLTLLSYILFAHVFRKLGTPDWARLLGLGLLCLLPIYGNLETEDFRFWDGGLAVALAAFLLLLLVESPAPPSGLKQTGLAFLGGLLFFVHPLVGLGGYCCLAIWSLKALSDRALVRALLLGACALGLFVLPWMLRNELALGSAVILRSNAGLELSLSTNPAMLTTSDRAAAFNQRLRAIHPTVNPAAGLAVREEGEIAYSDRLGKDARHWIATHPGTTLRLAVLHLREIMLPERWMFTLSSKAPGAGIRALIADIVNITGLAGLALALYRRRRGWIYILALIMTQLLAMTIFQPITRYIYVFWGVLVFCAVDLAAAVATGLASTRRMAGSRSP